MEDWEDVYADTSLGYGDYPDELEVDDDCHW